MGLSFFDRLNRRVGSGRILDVVRTIYGNQHEWHFHLIVRPMTMADGSVHDFMVMRRKVAGEWQYRAPTDDEKSEFDSHRYW
jgi:hypothetical protein